MRKPTDLRQKVLDASLALIEEGGLDRLSMREVARKAGVSHQAPYHYFADREAILAGIASDGFGMLQQELARSLDKQGASPKSAIEAVARTYVNFALRYPGYFRVMFRSDAVPIEDHPEALHNADAAFGELVQAIDRSFASEAGRGATHSSLCLLGIRPRPRHAAARRPARAPLGYVKGAAGRARRPDHQKLRRPFQYRGD